MSARLILDDEPGSWVEFTCGRRRFTARRDPMWLGHDDLPELLVNPRLLWRLMDDDSRLKSMTTAMVNGGLDDQLVAYLEAVGLSIFKLALATHALEDADLLEVDLLRIGVDIRDWLDPEGPLSTRRVVALYQDLLDRPETRVGAKRFDVKPIDKTGLAAVFFHTSFMDQGFEHSFIKSPTDLEQEAEQARIAAQKRERMTQDRRRVLSDGSGRSFESSQSESLRMLEELEPT
ncbi:hypothetical protein NLL38_03765 [Corynebacterium accolens]|uniref:hypothetical protein n=1 Tax=Corynebacterium accolens TaxID=38284 RepID=UPI00254DECD7|nr:hypothetical protein [Corynebacterium accolens]MDK8472400.1 hypothetical protein [Corynebacterium accolens]MDK8618475.1 hypothetical protein [Corynebacterium accolens]WKS69765.1 hypothetical protein NLL40_03755 [Corynebacterium accolens]WKS72042.1 hypothetical protein NLL38_03765 [Corynebacterium accolens]WKS74366.1 hypothetical protein NLL44_04095 [Corynebacterium accolens]